MKERGKLFLMKSTPSVPLLYKRRGKKKKEGLAPLLDAPLVN